MLARPPLETCASVSGGQTFSGSRARFKPVITVRKAIVQCSCAVCVCFEHQLYSGLKLNASVMDDNMAKTTVVSGEPHERDGGSDATYPGRPRRQIKPPRRFTEEDWDNYKPKSISRPTSTKSTPSKLSSTPGSGSQSSKSCETRKRSHLAELRLLQARKEAKARQVEEQRLAEEERRRAYEEFRRREEERRLTESRQIREFEYEAERLRLEARLEEEEERKDPESLMNRLRDFEDVEREDQRLQKANVQSTPYNQDHPTFLCNGTQTSERGMKEPKEKLNVSWVRKLCNSGTSLDPSRENGGELKSIFPRSLPKLELPRFAGNPLEWPTFISLLKCLVHDQRNSHPSLPQLAQINSPRD